MYITFTCFREESCTTLESSVNMFESHEPCPVVVNSLSAHAVVHCVKQNTHTVHTFLQVLALRTLHEQLLHLVSPAEQQELNLSHTFTPFTGEEPA